MMAAVETLFLAVRMIVENHLQLFWVLILSVQTKSSSNNTYQVLIKLRPKRVAYVPVRVLLQFKMCQYKETLVTMMSGLL